MNYWLIALPRDQLQFCIKIGTFGLNRKYILGRIARGDKVVCYATKDRKIIALGEVTVPYYVDDTKVFNDPKLFPTDSLYIDRINFKATKIPQELDFVPLIEQMTFIKSLANWQVHFRSAITQISSKDWDLIHTQARGSSAIH